MGCGATVRRMLPRVGREPTSRTRSKRPWALSGSKKMWAQRAPRAQGPWFYKHRCKCAPTPFPPARLMEKCPKVKSPSSVGVRRCCHRRFCRCCCCRCCGCHHHHHQKRQRQRQQQPQKGDRQQATNKRQQTTINKQPKTRANNQQPTANNQQQTPPSPLEGRQG